MPTDFGLLSDLCRPPSGRTRRVSSNEQPNWNDGNMDMTWLQPGEMLEMPLLEGPGVIRHIWFTSHSGGMGELDTLSLRMYWDGSDTPSVEVPVGMFFAVGQGSPAPVESIPVQVSPTGSLTCYWPMPFFRSARITVTNDNPHRGTGLYWQVDWEQIADLPEDTLLFHAAYRQEFPAQSGSDYLIADIDGCGRYVGTVMTVTLAQDGWFGEGDDFFYVDGEAVPSLQGTGTEDYFNDAWGFRERTGLWFGQPRWEGYATGDSGVCYRWHVPDPVCFSKSLRVSIEHKGNLPRSEDGFFIERPDFLSSIAYWYQRGVASRRPELPNWPERNVPWHSQHLLEAFLAVRVIGEARPRIGLEGMFGGQPVLEWPNADPEAVMTVPFVAPRTGRFAVRLRILAAPDGGAFDVEIDGTQVSEACDMCASDTTARELSLGTHVLEEGMHTLAFRALPSRTGVLRVDRLRMLELPPEASRPIKGRNEAHFIRLGIGRALYAHRLAFGKLPDTLEELVADGIMDERYLSDENGVPLEAQRDGDSMVVRAPGWTHRWQGLDARR
ncbi:MAG: DUF2961 domain-containing protein [Chthonomonadales bacterium]|nr:DUF2961 domain-containing protein [Chthonomonadales bacterium]